MLRTHACIGLFVVVGDENTLKIQRIIKLHLGAFPFKILSSYTVLPKLSPNAALLGLEVYQ